MSTPQERFESYHATHGDQRRSRDQRIAEGFVFNETYERWLKMPGPEREAFLEKLASTQRIALGHYRETKSAAQRTGRDVTS